MSTAEKHFHWFRLQKSCFAICILSQLHMTPMSAGQELTISAQIRDALLRNAEALTPVTVEWKLQRHSDRSIEDLVKDLGSKRYDFYRPEEGFFALDGNKFFLYEKVERNPPPADDNKDIFTQDKYTSAFDGEAFFTLESGAVKTCDVRTVEQMMSKQMTPDVITWFGFQIRTGKRPQSDIIWHLEHGGKLLSISEAKVDESRCTVVRIVPEQWIYPYWKDRQYKYYLDIERNYAVARIDWELPNGRLLCTIRNSEWRKLDSPEIWLPRKSSCEWHTWHFCPDRSFKEVFFYEDFTISELSRKNWPHTKFSPDLNEPGLMVSDPRPYARSKPGALWNASSGKWDYTNPADLPRMAPRKSSPWRTVLIAGNVVLFILIGVSIWLKRRNT